MRIVKLSKKEFPTTNQVKNFFCQELRGRTPAGKFRITPSRIAQKDGLLRGERLVFTHDARIVFTACADSQLVQNLDDTDKYKEKYQHYFVVDLDTLQEANIELHEFEERYNNLSGKHINLVKSQGWNRLDDSNHTNGLWEWLRKNQT